MGIADVGCVVLGACVYCVLCVVCCVCCVWCVVCVVCCVLCVVCCVLCVVCCALCVVLCVGQLVVAAAVVEPAGAGGPHIAGVTAVAAAVVVAVSVATVVLLLLIVVYGERLPAVLLRGDSGGALIIGGNVSAPSFPSVPSTWGSVRRRLVPSSGLGRTVFGLDPVNGPLLGRGVPRVSAGAA